MDLETQGVILAHVAIAVALGGAIGFDRELAEKPAGFRTQMLVAGAAAMLVAIGQAYVTHAVSQRVDAHLRLDPIRVVEAVITGVSVLGAGTIIHHQREGSRVEGLTTAASLLFSAAVGICIGLRLYVLAVGATAIALIVLRGMRPIEKRLRTHHPGGGEGPPGAP